VWISVISVLYKSAEEGRDVSKYLNGDEVMRLVRNRDIVGLANYEHIHRLPQELLNVRRISTYDKPISEAKAGRIIKMSFQSEKIATNRYLALRQKLKTEKTLALVVRKSAKWVYLFPRKLLEK
jgi:hypothetical protein